MKYAQLDTRFKRRPHRIFKGILDAWTRQEAPRILDVGCASGVIGQLRGSKENVIGIERDPRLRESAARNCQRLYDLDLNGFRRGMIAERDFDLIFCGDVLEHLVDPDAVLKELVGLLAAGGRIVISLPNVAQLPIRLKLFFGRFDYTESGIMSHSHLHFYTSKTALMMIREAGLTVERFYPAGTVVSFLNVLPTLLAAQLIFVCRKDR